MWAARSRGSTFEFIGLMRAFGDLELFGTPLLRGVAKFGRNLVRIDQSLGKTRLNKA